MSPLYAAYSGGQPRLLSQYRKNSLTVKGIAQPGDRVREFGENLIYKHPRGGDLTLRSKGQARDRSRTGLPQLAFVDRDRRTRGNVNLVPAAPGQYRHTMKNVTNEQLVLVPGRRLCERSLGNRT